MQLWRVQTPVSAIRTIHLHVGLVPSVYNNNNNNNNNNERGFVRRNRGLFNSSTGPSRSNKKLQEIQGGSNMTGTDLCVRLYKSVPVIFEPPCIF